MKITGEEAKTLSDAVATASSGLAALPPKVRADIIGHVIRGATGLLADFEKQLADAGKMPGDLVAVLMVYGAVATVLGDLPAGDDRRQVFDAGKRVGELISAKFGEKIQEQLTKKIRGN
jgi:hypothetical protein